MRGRLTRLAASLSAGASVIHLVMAPDHLSEWWGYGAFFILAAAGQGLLSVLILRGSRSGSWHGPSASPVWTFAAGAVGNTAIVALYVVSRSIGLPLVGPEAGEIEPISPAGIVSVLAEIGIVVILLGLIFGGRTTTEPSESAALHSPPTGDPGPERVGPIRMAIAGALTIGAASAVLAVLPRAIAATHGGAGPGSALLVGEVAAVGAVALGALLAAIQLARSSSVTVLPVAAVLGAAAITASSENHLGLAAILTAYTVMGMGVGAIGTTLFARASTTGGSERALVVGALLLGALAGAQAARLSPEPAFERFVSNPALAWLAALVALLLVLSWREDGRPSARASRAHLDAAQVGSLVVGAVVFGTGTVAISAGLDATRIIATLIGGPFGIGYGPALDGWRIGLLVGGLFAGALGIGLALRAMRLPPPLAVAAAMTGVIAFVASGTASILAYLLRSPAFTPGERGIALLPIVVAVATAAGIVAAVAVARAADRWWDSARFGGLALCAVALSTILLAALGLTGLGPLVILGSATVAASAAGLASTFLRARLADVPPDMAAWAAAAGVTLAAVGALTGALTGNAVGSSTLQSSTDAGWAMLLLGATALVSAGLVIVRRDGREARGRSAVGPVAER